MDYSDNVSGPYSSRTDNGIDMYSMSRRGNFYESETIEICNGRCIPCVGRCGRK